MNDKEKSYQKELMIALGAIREAAVLCQAVQGDIGTEAIEKKDRSPVTIADFGSQALICRAIGRAFPNDPIIGEEDSSILKEPGNEAIVGQLMDRIKKIRPAAEPDAVFDWIDKGNAKQYSERFWTLDPIDGTKGFLRGDQYAISLALIVDGKIQIAFLGCPNLKMESGEKGILLSAISGRGAFAMPLDGDGNPKKIEVSDTADERFIRFCESVEAAHSSHSDAAKIADKLKIQEEPVRIDSQAKYAQVAMGAAEAYLRLPKDGEYREKIWDHAGGVLIVEEAGGTVTDINGKPLKFDCGHTLEDNLGVIVSCGSVHDAILGAIKDLKIGQF